MKYVRIIDNIAYDVTTTDPVNLFTPEIAIQFTQIPEKVQNFWMLAEGVWSAPSLPVPEADPNLTLHHAKTARLAGIDRETSESILAGFDFAVNETIYHFSYDSLDQQNFTDAATTAQMALSGTRNIPSAVVWNAYTVPKGDLVRLYFDAVAFLQLYTAGALAHKSSKMEIGGARKAAVLAATTIEEVDSL